MAISDIPGDINQAKKRDRAAERQAMAQTISQTRQNVGGAIADFGSQTTDKMLDTVTGGVGRRFIVNTPFDSRLPGQDIRDRKRAEAAKGFVRNNPERAAAADQYGQGVIDRTLTAGLRTEQPSPMAVAGGPKPVMPAPGKPQAASAPVTNPAAQPAPAQAIAQPAAQGRSDRVMPDNAPAGEMGNVGYGGIVGRRNANGVMEFSNSGQDVAAASGQRMQPGQGIGDGIGGMSVTSGGQEAMDRNNRATAIMQQTRLENSGPGLLVAGIRGDDGADGMINRRDRKQERGRRDEQNAQRQQAIAQGAERLAAADTQRQDRAVQERLLATEEQRAQLGDNLTRQQIEQGDLAMADERRLRELRGIIADPNAGEEAKQQARRALQDLTSTGKSRFITVVGGTDDLGAKQPSRVFDTATQRFVDPAGDAGGSDGQMTLVGYSDGKPVYEDASGARFIDDE